MVELLESMSNVQLLGYKINISHCTYNIILDTTTPQPNTVDSHHSVGGTREGDQKSLGRGGWTHDPREFTLLSLSPPCELRIFPEWEITLTRFDPEYVSIHVQTTKSITIAVSCH